MNSPSRRNAAGPALISKETASFLESPSGTGKLEGSSGKPMLRFLLNVLWFVLGGLVMGLGWWLAGLVAAITIIGIPFGIQHIKLALIALAPIGMQVVPARR